MQAFKFSRAMGLVVTLIALTMWVTSAAQADTFRLKIGSGQPMKPLEPIFMADSYFAPTVTERVKKETGHDIKFTKLWNTVSGPFDVLEGVEKGLFDIGLWCACFEPDKGVHLAFHYFVPFVTDDPKTQLAITKKTLKEFPEWTKSLDKYNQTWLGAGTFSTYGLGTKFKWSKMSDLKGKKVAGAGPNLPWLKLSGATAVQTSLNEAYNSLNSGVYEGLVIFPTAWYGFKLHEPAKVYTIVGWGSTSIYQMTMNNNTLNKLPADVQKIIKEVADTWMDKTAEESTKRFGASLDNLKKAGSTIQELAFEERTKMAVALNGWVNEKAKEFDAKGLPATKLFKRYLQIAEEMGVKLPHKYDIK